MRLIDADVMNMESGQKTCIRCGGPRPPRATKYCEACRKKIKAERDKAGRLKQYMKERAQRAQESVPAPHRPKKKKLTPAEREAAERAKTRNGFIAKDVVVCRGCKWYSMETHTCDYYLRTMQPRPWPKDCYKHEGTPYTPRRKEG